MGGVPVSMLGPGLSALAEREPLQVWSGAYSLAPFSKFSRLVRVTSHGQQVPVLHGGQLLVWNNGAPEAESTPRSRWVFWISLAGRRTQSLN